jgi:Trypsin-co-occurring domain 1
MKRLIEFRQDDETVFVEVEEDISRADQLSGRGGAVERAKQSFEEAVSGIDPIANMILRKMAALGPESVSIEFGIKFNAQAGVILASSAIEGNCKVTLGWKPKPRLARISHSGNVGLLKGTALASVHDAGRDGPI